MDLYSVDFVHLRSNDGFFWFDWIGFGIARNAQCRVNVKGHALGYINENGKIYEFHDHMEDPDIGWKAWQDFEKCKNNKQEI